MYVSWKQPNTTSSIGDGVGESGLGLGWPGKRLACTRLATAIEVRMDVRRLTNEFERRACTLIWDPPSGPQRGWRVVE